MIDTITLGRLPTQGPTTTANIPAKTVGYGSVELVGVSNRSVDLPIFRAKIGASFAEMFNLPHDVEEKRLERLEQLANVRQYDVECRPLTYSKTNAELNWNCQES